MDQLIEIPGMDPLLVPFLSVTDVSDSEQLLAKLIQNHADPVIARIIKTKLHVSLNYDQGSKENQDALDIASNLRASLIADLRELQKSSTHRAIASFPDYVAIKTFSACSDYFREKNPQRSRLKSLLRRHLKDNPQFDLWKTGEYRWYAGLSAWRETPTDNGLPQAGQGALEGTVAHAYLTLPEGSSESSSTDKLLSDIFETAGRAIEFDRVVAIAAGKLGIKDLADESVEDYYGDGGKGLVDPGPRIDLALEQRMYLESLWIEVRQLPVLQRTALLLNLRDARGGSVIGFIPYLEIASRAEIAAMVAIPPERFDQLWDDLPLDDSSLAKLLQLTRQQVINLRKTARERLARRIKKLEESGKDSATSGKKPG